MGVPYLYYSDVLSYGRGIKVLTFDKLLPDLFLSFPLLVFKRRVFYFGSKLIVRMKKVSEEI